MKRFIPILLLAVGLASCSWTLQNMWDVVTSSRVSPTMVVVAASTFDGLEATATNYLRLKRCTGSNGPVCRSPIATKSIVPAIRSGRVARNNLEQFMRDHPGQLGSSGTYAALIAANDTLQNIFAQYGVNK